MNITLALSAELNGIEWLVYIYWLIVGVFFADGVFECPQMTGKGWIMIMKMKWTNVKYKNYFSFVN